MASYQYFPKLGSDYMEPIFKQPKYYVVNAECSYICRDHDDENLITNIKKANLNELKFDVWQQINKMGLLHWEKKKIPDKTRHTFKLWYSIQPNPRIEVATYTIDTIHFIEEIQLQGTGSNMIDLVLQYPGSLKFDTIRDYKSLSTRHTIIFNANFYKKEDLDDNNIY